MSCLPLFIPIISSTIISITTAIVNYILRRPTTSQSQSNKDEDIITNITEKNDILDEKEKSFLSIDIVKHHHKDN